MTIKRKEYMMHNFFECKIRYEKVMDDGKNKKVTEPYLVDALSFTEAEKRIIEEMKPFITGEFTVEAIKRYNVTELFECDDSDADTWFRVKANFITLDEKSGLEKKAASYMLVQASDIKDAQKRFEEGMKGTLSDYQVEKILETKIMDVYEHK